MTTRFGAVMCNRPTAELPHGHGLTSCIQVCGAGRRV
jgi:hypothetical protein